MLWVIVPYTNPIPFITKLDAVTVHPGADIALPTLLIVISLFSKEIGGVENDIISV